MDRQNQQDEEDRFTIVSLDESFFFYDYLVRRVWIDEKKRPIVRVTGSHKHSCIFGAISMEEGNHQLFRQYERFNGDTFLDYLKIIHSRFPRCYLFMDKASPHYKSKKVLKYFEENKNDLIPQHIFQLHHHRVYGYRRDMEHSKTRSAGAKILSIVCRF